MKLTPSLHSFVSIGFALATFGILGNAIGLQGTQSWADEPQAGTTLITAPAGEGVSLCGVEPDCRTRIMSFLGILNPGFPVKAEVGARVSFNDAQGNAATSANAAVTLSDHLAAFSNWGGTSTSCRLR